MKTLGRFSAVIVCLFLLLAASSCDDKKPTVDTLRYKTPLTYRIFPELGANISASETTHFDRKDQRTGSATYTFDDLGRLSSVMVENDFLNIPFRQYVYDEEGKLTGVFDSEDNNLLVAPTYDGELNLRVITYTGEGVEKFYYDTLGRLSGHTDVLAFGDSVFTNYVYDGDLHKLIQKTVRHGRMVYVYDLDSNGRITTVSKKQFNKRFSKLTDIDMLTYTYDDAADSIAGIWSSADVYNARNKKTGYVTNRYYLLAEALPEDQEPVSASSATAVHSGSTPSALAVAMTSYVPASEGNFIVNYFDDALARFNLVSDFSHSPGPVLLIILAVLTLAYTALAIYWLNEVIYMDDMFDYWWGNTERNGMKKLWMFTPNPYTRILWVFGALIAAFIASILTLLVVGVVVWLLLWAVKLLLIVLVWAGWAALILGILSIFGGEILVGIIVAVIGGAIVHSSDEISAFGNRIVEWGFSFMEDLNFFEWIMGIFVYLWDVILTVFFSPVALFLGVAAFVITIVLLLMGFEWIVMRFYNIKRPCPTCGCTDEFVYLVDDVHAHPVALHPGVNGVFTHKDSRGNSVPTMIFNGKGRIKRKCCHCNSIEHNAGTHTIGTEKHIGVVGNRSSGKTYFLYSALSHLLSDKVTQTDVTPSTDIRAMADRIRSGQGVQTQVSNLYKATQIMAKRANSPVPWHLFFYDVAGENFDSQAVRSASALRFYKNVELIVFVIDPTQIDLNRTPLASAEARKWISAHQAPADERVSPESTFSRLSSILQENGRDSRKIDMVFLLTKHDLGYMPSGMKTEEYVRHQLGQDNLVNTACNSFRSVSFCASSVRGNGIRVIMKSILKIIGVEF